MTDSPSPSPKSEPLPADPCADLEAKILAGQSARAEDAIAALPTGSGPEQALDLIYAEYLARLELNRARLEEELCARFPQWRVQLRRQFRLHDYLSETIVGEPDGKAEPTRESDALLTQVGPYRLLGTLGRGGAGVVYRAARDGSAEEVALKVARGAGEPALRTGAAVLARLNHPTIVRQLDAGEADGRFFLALELVAGGTLTNRLAAGPLPPAAAAQLVGVLACAVEYVHRRGFAHLDLTPNNVLLTADGAPKLIDFGCARALRGDTVADPADAGPLGTPAYLAPEQAAGDRAQLGVRTDVYALGGLLYEALTGRRPFHAHTLAETLALVLTAAPLSPRALRPEIPAGLEAVCLKCLAKDPADRFATAAELAAALLAHATKPPAA